MYQEAKDAALTGVVLKKIEWDLNNRNIPGPTGGIWHENTIRRMLISETGLGHITTNKTQGSGHKQKKAKPFKNIPKE
ncbi:recombinase family protein [Paenibacillus mangrovi]|uniref:recombinase family protein n=1 Tax=Paenibacillus mangrovi TaxID=2931978 RepID=UPI0031407BF1